MSKYELSPTKKLLILCMLLVGLSTILGVPDARACTPCYLCDSQECDNHFQCYRSCGVPYNDQCLQQCDDDYFRCMGDCYDTCCY